MKKFVFKATALAIGALVGGGAYAAVAAGVDFDAASPTISKYAKELAYVDATPLASVAAINVTTKLGFGVSNSQTRYIRIDYANATLDAAHAAVGGTDIEINNHGAADTYAVVQGGAVGDSYVIYQVTAAADHAATTVVDIKTPALRVTSNGSPVAVTYSLHETAVSAVAGASGGAKLYSKTQNIATFATGLALTIDTKPTTTASVEAAFKEFKTGGGYIAVDTVKLGSITFGPVAGVKAWDGSTDVAITDLLAATGTKIVLNGDTSIPKGTTDTLKKNSVFISSDANCAGVGLAASAVPTSSGASFATDQNAYATKGICYVVDGSAISASTYTVGVTVAAKSGTTTSSIDAVTFGTIDRDGTELQAPFTTIHPDYLSRVVLTSQHSSDAAVTFSAITEDGVTVPTINSAATLKAGKQLVVNVKDIVPSLSAGSRLAIKAVIAAPKSKIEGVYNVMNYDAVTGKTNSLISYQLARPAN